MATTYDKASLVMIPSGYKDDKLYAVKPTDGSGDFTFSRDGAGASPATRVNASGLIEKGRENLLLQSNQFDTTWVLNNGSTLTSGQSGYDGSSNAWLLTKPATSFTNVAQTISSSGVVTFSVRLKAGTLTKGTIRLIGTDVNVVFDLSAGTIFGGTSTGWIDRKITDLGSGWYLCSITAVYGSGTQVGIYPDEITNTTAGNIYIQDAQLESGLVATDYIETTTAPVSAGLLGDMPRLDYSGGATCPSLLLEPSRVNLVTHSEYIEGLNVTGGMTMTANYATSPEGVENAYLMARATSGNFNYDISATSGQNYVLSVFAKAGTSSIINITTTDAAFPTATIQFDLSDQSTSVTLGTFVDSDIEDYGNGWYRCWAVQSATATGNGEVRTNTDDNVNVLVWGVSCELGSYPTSYIPTYGSASTRGADDCSLNPTSLVGSDEGSWFIDIEDFEYVIQGTTLGSVFIGDAEADYIGIVGRSVGYDGLQFAKRESGSATTIYSAASIHTAKVCFTWKGSNLKLFFEGNKVYDNDSFANFTNWDFYELNYPSRAVRYNLNQNLLFPTQLTDAEAIALTTR